MVCTAFRLSYWLGAHGGSIPFGSLRQGLQPRALEWPCQPLHFWIPLPGCCGRMCSSSHPFFCGWPESPSGASFRHLNAFPESDVILDLFGGLTWLSVVPHRVMINLIVDDDVVVAGFAFPMACGVRFAWAQVLAVHRCGREVMVAFYNDCLIAFGQNGAVPYRFHRALLRRIVAALRGLFA